MKPIAQQTEAELLHTLSRAQHWKGQTDNPAQRVGYTRLIDAANSRLAQLSTLASTPPPSVDQSVEESVESPTPSTPPNRVVNTPQQQIAPTVEPSVERPRLTVEDRPQTRQISTVKSTPRPSVEVTVEESVEACSNPVDNTAQQSGELADRDGVPVWLHVNPKTKKVESKTLALVKSSLATRIERVQAAEDKIRDAGGFRHAHCRTVAAWRNNKTWLRYWQDAKEQLEAAHRAAIAVPVNE